MKLLFVLPEYGPDARGGIATFYRHLIPGLLRSGCAVDVCVTGHPRSVAEMRDQPDVRVIGITSADRERAASRFPHLAALPGIAGLLADAFAAWEACDHGHGYDVVEATDWNQLYVPWLVDNSGPPVVVQLHGSNGQLDYYDPLEENALGGTVTRMLETALLTRADELHSGGPGNAMEWSRLLGRPVEHISPAWRANEGPAESMPDWADQDFGLVVGRIQRWKGPELLCQAVGLLRERAPRIFWVGRDHPFRRLDRSLSDYLGEEYPGVWGRGITPVGETSRSVTAALQAKASFVVVPSTWDVFNYTAAEAMSAAKVVICSEGAGAAQLIEQGKNGFRFPAGDAACLAELLTTASSLSPMERDTIGQRARETVSRELDAERIAARHIDRFARLIAAPRNVRSQHPWIEGMFAASDTRPPFAFLETLPLREIMRHAARRSIERLRSGLR